MVYSSTRLFCWEDLECYCATKKPNPFSHFLQQEEQINTLKRQHHEQAIYHDEEISFHQAAIKRHQDAIERHKLLKTQSEAQVRQTEDMEKQQIMADKKR